MNAPLAGKAAVIWGAMLVLAVANGLFRESLLVPLAGPFWGLVISGVLLSSLILAISYWAVGWFAPVAPVQAVMIGVIWLGATLAFELILGRYLTGKSWQELAAAYSFAGGNLWPLVLLTIAVSPWLCARLRGLV